MPGPIFVVSDDPAVVEEVRFALPSDIEVVTALDAREAVGVLEHVTPAAVIVDLMTGRAGGFALARDMSQTGRLAGIPIVVLIERDQDRWLAGKAGAAEILRKPVHGPDLLEAVLSVLGENLNA
jgi:DNA-binding response OmpR family regulator